MHSGWQLGAALACCFVLGWGARGATDVRKPVSVTRIYTGSDGLSHAEEIRDVKLMPDAARNGLEASDVINVTGLRLHALRLAGFGTGMWQNVTSTSSR